MSRGNKNPTPAEHFPPATIAAYRKLADHADRLDEYVEQTDDVPTQTDFLKFATGKYAGGTQARIAKCLGVSLQSVSVWLDISYSKTGKANADARVSMTRVREVRP